MFAHPKDLCQDARERSQQIMDEVSACRESQLRLIYTMAQTLSRLNVCFALGRKHLHLLARSVESPRMK